jgi:ABC-type amino acid transport substrate-binding protein
MNIMTHWCRRLVLAAGAALLFTAFTGAASEAQPITPPGGRLKCDVSGGLSYIVGSSRALDCVYTPDGFPPEFYQGRINKIGVDVGFQRRGVIVWAVLSPGLTRGPGALTGNYVGLSADVAAGLGAGANALIGGNKVVLQPLSVSGNIGINLAAGIGNISLTYVGGAVPMIREYVPFVAQ